MSFPAGGSAGFCSEVPAISAGFCSEVSADSGRYRGPGVGPGSLAGRDVAPSPLVSRTGSPTCLGSLLGRDGPLSLAALGLGFEWEAHRRGREGRQEKQRERERRKGGKDRGGPVRLQTHGGRGVSVTHTGTGSLTSQPQRPLQPRPGRHCHCSERAPSGRRGEDMVPPSWASTEPHRERRGRRGARGPAGTSPRGPMGADSQ